MVVVLGKYGTHHKHDLTNSISFQITGSISYKQKYVECGTHTKAYNLDDLNNNNILIHGVLSDFVLRCKTSGIHSGYENMGQRYIDEGFLVWIILSTY